MYVYIYVSMWVCMHVCMYVCIHVCIHEMVFHISGVSASFIYFFIQVIYTALINFSAQYALVYQFDAVPSGTIHVR